MPEGIPDLTLGWGVIRHATHWLKQPNGPKAGHAWEPIPSQARWLLWWYAVDENGDWLYTHGARRLAKGSGKSPFAAVQAIEELVGPVRLKDFDPKVLGGCVGQPQDMALVQIAATAASQTANTMRMVRAMTAPGTRIVRELGMLAGKTQIYVPRTSSELQIITSSADAQEGAEVTFAIEDETEHWVPAQGGPNLAETLARNLLKSGSRAVETANAWEPGEHSVAEATYDGWRLEQEGRTRGDARTLYDARIAPADTNLADEASLTAALEFVYDDCEWVVIKGIRDGIWDPKAKPDKSRRFYLNQPTAAVDAWTTPMAWEALKAPEGGRKVEDGEDVVLFLDPSGSRDATGIAGCAMSDGFVFTVDVWEPENTGEDAGFDIPVAEVDIAVDQAFECWNVVAFFSDVTPLEGLVKITWPEKHADKLLIMASPHGKDPQSIAWDMRSKAWDFTLACELTETEIRDGRFQHDGNPVMKRHVENARNRRGRYGMSIGKESKDSPKKIDLAVCMIGARMVRRLVLASPEWAKYNRPKPKRLGRVIVLS